MAGADFGFKYYHYDPSLAAAAVILVLFAISTLVHLFQLIRFRTWYFIPFVIGGICETIGYGGRIGSALETPNWTLTPYIIQTLLILIAPALFAASIYMVLRRIVILVDGAQHSIIPVKWLTKVFVTLDVISFMMQGAGGGLLSGAKDTAGFNLGQNVIIGGLAVQLVAFSVFVVVAFRFHRRISRFPTEASQTTRVPWQRFLYVLYAVSALILIRSIFRIIEYGQGWTGSLQDSEYWLYIFDAALMLSAMLLLNIWHPSRIISMGKREGLDSSDTEGCHQLRPPRATKH